MNQIDLNKIMDTYDISKKEMSKKLFPDVKYKAMALKRVLEKEALLNEWQIKRLSTWLQIPIENLFNGCRWKIKLAKNVFILNSDDFRAEVYPDTGETLVFHKDSLFSEKLLHSPTIPLSTLLKEVETLITKYLNK